MNNLLACSQLFMHLQAIEPMLNPRYAVRLTRQPCHDGLNLKSQEPGAYLIFEICDHGSALFNVDVWSVPVDPRPIMSGRYTAEEAAGLLWERIPKQYKQK